MERGIDGSTLDDLGSRMPLGHSSSEWSLATGSIVHCPLSIARLLTITTLLAVVASPVLAEPLDTFGYDARAIATGGGAAGVALSKSAAALYANPAALVRATPSIGWDYIMVHPLITIRPMAGSTAAGDTVLDEPQHTIVMGVVSDFGVKGFRMGTLLKTPIPVLASMRFRHFDEREQAFSNRLHMVRFGEGEDMIFFQTGAAYRPLDWFSFGVSLKTNFLLRSRTTTATIGGDGTTAAQNGGADFEIRFRPQVGVAFRPLEWLHIGLTYRMESRLEGEFETRIVTEDASGARTVTTEKDAMTAGFEPHEVALGVGVEMDGWFAEASGTWSHWSAFRSVQRRPPEEEGGRFAWSDAAKVALSGGWAYAPWGEALIGMAFLQSPVPDQVGRTNFVDTHALGLTAGHRFRFQLIGIQMETGLFFQAWHLFDEQVRKDPALIVDEDLIVDGLQTGNPGYPGYEVGGWTFVAGASLRLEL
jgi:long-chain fatty acid transport protein